MSLTHEQETALAQRTMSGDKMARDEFITANIPLVVHIAKHYIDRGMELDDLTQEGMFGLITAVERFNHHKGLKFCTYATYWIHQTIGRAIDNQSRLIRLPVNIREQITGLIRAIKALETELDRYPYLEEIANRTGLKVDKIVSLLKSSRPPAYLEDLVIAANKVSKASDNSNTGIEEVPVLSKSIESEEPVFDKVSKRELSEKVNQALSKLTSREEQVIRWRYGIGDGCGPCKEQTRQEMSEYFKVSGERIRQIEAKALSKLKPLLEPVLEVSSGGCADKACAVEACAYEARAGGGCADKDRAPKVRTAKAHAHKSHAGRGREVHSRYCAKENNANRDRVDGGRTA